MSLALAGTCGESDTPSTGAGTGARGGGDGCRMLYIVDFQQQSLLLFFIAIEKVVKRTAEFSPLTDWVVWGTRGTIQ